MDSEKLKYKFIAIIALKYRLSLDSIKSVFGIKLDTNELYDKIMKYNVAVISDEMSVKLRYLFTETTNERPKVAATSRINAYNYIKKFGLMLPRELKDIEKDIEESTSSNDVNRLDKLKLEKEAYEEIFKEEIEYEKFKKNYLEGKVSLYSGMNIIAAYRIKNVVSQLVVCEELGAKRKTVYYEEDRIKDPILREKVDRLNDFILNLYTYIRKDSKQKK